MAVVREPVRLAGLRFLPLAANTVLLGYGLALLGRDDTWMPLAYVGLITVVVLL